MPINDLNPFELMGITAAQAAAIALGTFIMYTFLVILLRFVGQRINAQLSTYDMAAIIIMGAVAARATLGHAPTVAGGLVALTVLTATRALLRWLGLSRRGDRVINNHPIVVMAGTEILAAALKQAHVEEDELWVALRQAGIRNDDEIAAVILESNGQFSVLRKGMPIDPRILENTDGAERIPAEFIGDKDYGDAGKHPFSKA